YIADQLAAKGRKPEGEQLRESGLMAAETSELLIKHPELLDHEKHPEVGKVRALYYPENALQNVGAPGTPDFQAQGIPLYFYLYREGDSWILQDVTTPHQVKVNKESGGTGTEPPKELFMDLN